MANYYSTDYNKILEEERSNLSNIKKTKQDAINKTHDSQKQVLNDEYGTLIDETKVAYENEYERNAVQKLINERQIAERNANLGLTDSGLNRTQQTAAQMSYANQKGKIDLAKKGALDKLTQNLASSLSSIEQSRIASLADLDASIESQAQSNAISRHNANVDANAKMYAAEQDAIAKVNVAAIEGKSNTPTVSYGAGGTSTGGYIVSSSTGTLARDYSGSLKDNGVSTVYSYNTDGSIKKVTYTDSNSGKSVSFDGGVNPYTGKMHGDLLNEEGFYDSSRAFSNGYQPNNIKGEKLVTTNATWNVYNREQKVFKLKSNGKYYVWRGDLNRYQELTAAEAASVGLY